MPLPHLQYSNRIRIQQNDRSYSNAFDDNKWVETKATAHWISKTEHLWSKDEKKYLCVVDNWTTRVKNGASALREKDREKWDHLSFNWLSRIAIRHNCELCMPFNVLTIDSQVDLDRCASAAHKGPSQLPISLDFVDT